METKVQKADVTDLSNSVSDRAGIWAQAVQSPSPSSGHLHHIPDAANYFLDEEWLPFLHTLLKALREHRDPFKGQEVGLARILPVPRGWSLKT